MKGLNIYLISLLQILSLDTMYNRFAHVLIYKHPSCFDLFQVLVRGLLLKLRYAIAYAIPDLSCFALF